MMTNLYPFLMGEAALKHERIPYFPEMPDPQNHILVAHCGFFGVVPQSFATEWTLSRGCWRSSTRTRTRSTPGSRAGATTIVKLSGDHRTR